MKQLLSLAILLAVFNGSFAQSVDDIKKLVGKSDWVAAKKAVDQFLANDKNAAKPDGWYYKGLIYNECSKKEETASLCDNCKKEAFEAFKKYQSMDAKNIYMILEENVRLFDLYNGFFDVGAKAFGNKDYNIAYTNFGYAADVEAYIRSKNFEYNGFKFGELDTSLVQNMALAARLGKKDAESVGHYERLINAGLSGPNNLEMYQYVAQYYAENKNTTALNAVLAKAQKLYPEDPYWTEVELEMVDKKDKPVLFAKYEELTAKNPNNYPLAYNYGVELFNYMYVGDNKPADFEGFKKKLESTLKKAIAIKNTGDANLIMARHIYNDVYDIQDAIKKNKGTKPEDAKKRVELKSQSLKIADECILYAGEAAKIFGAMEKLKPIEKANYKNALSILESMYTFKGDAAKAAEYKKQAEAVDNIPADKSKGVIEAPTKQSNGVVNLTETSGGVYKIPCIINGLKLDFIFDSGASDVSISLTEAAFMLKNGYLKKSDITGSSKYQNANGEISDGVNLNIRELEIAGIKIYNVTASVVNNLKAPLLLGQSALSKFGKYTFDYNKKKLILGDE